MLKKMASRTQFADAEFERALKVSLESFPHILGLKEEQICCLQSVAKKLDVFGILPTGFGKSLIFQLLPRLLKEMWNLERSTVVVVTPLVSIIKDQVEELTRLGLRALAIGIGNQTDEEDLRSGGFEVDLIYGSPETWCSKQWSKELKEGQLGKQVVCFVVDEAHSVSAWYVIHIYSIIRKYFARCVYSTMTSVLYFLNLITKL